MRLHSGLDSSHLVCMLGQALHKQSNTWKPVIYSELPVKDNTVSPSQRDGVVQWMSQLNIKFRFYPETQALSVTILDRFLQIVKARPKYLRCIGVSCFYLAAKTLEEDEVIPSMRDLVDTSECECNVAEILRMERIILDKLQWQLNSVTPLNFIHIIHALLLSKCPHLLDQFPQMSPSRQLSILTKKLQTCLADHHLTAFPPAVLALALISLELELFKPDWLAYTITIQQMTGVGNQQLISCREIISRQLALCQSSLYSAYRPVRTVKPGKRKMEQLSDDDEEDLYDSLKRLYNEDETVDVEVSMISCAGEVYQESEDRASLQSVKAN